MNHNISAEHLVSLFLNKTPLIDVRAPVEFQEGTLPGAINLPILNDEERALVGTTYKKIGSEAAVKLGHQLVSGENKAQKLKLWKDFIQSNPNAVLFCFRGGQRSQITQVWLQEAGIKIPLIQGGYKATRQFLLEQELQFSNAHQLLSLTGPTGSGKTSLLQKIKDHYPTLQLEHLAMHRGSAFGALDLPQPRQASFENQLAVDMLRVEQKWQRSRPVLVEDESRLIGKCALPNTFFQKMRISPVIFLDEPLESRVDHIYQEYILDTPIVGANLSEAKTSFERYKSSLKAIQKKLGGDRFVEIMKLISEAESDSVTLGKHEKNKLWIERLLSYYYDPLYAASLGRRDVKVIFRGPEKACLDYLLGTV